MCRVAQHYPADAVQTRHVGHRVHHGNVTRADEGLHVAGCKGGNHQLWHTDRQSAQTGGHNGGAASAADTEDAADIIARDDEVTKGLAHRLHRRTAVADAEHMTGAARMKGSDALGVHVRFHTGGAGSNIDEQCRRAGGLHQRLEVCEFRTLGVSCSDDIDVFHGAKTGAGCDRPAMPSRRSPFAMVVLRAPPRRKDDLYSNDRVLT